MKKEKKTRGQLISELAKLRQRIAELEKSEAEHELKVQTLRESKELFEKIFVSQLDVFFILDAKNPPKILNCNPSTTRVFGYSRKEMLGRTTDFLHVDKRRRQKFQEHLYAAIDKQGFFHHPEFAMQRKDGTVFPTEHTVVSLEDDQGKRIGWVSVVRDISERKWMERRLKESEAYIEGILNAAPSGIGLVRKRELNWVSNRMCEMLGYSADELIGQSARIVYESDAEFERVGRVKYSEIHERGVGSVETRFKRKDGSVIDVLLCSSATDTADLTQGTIFTALDITERKQAEQQLRESEERYRSLFKNNHSVMLLIDPESAEIVDANPAACSFYGWSPEELTSKKITDINMLTSEQVFQEIERAKSEERNHFFFRHRLASGEMCDVEVYSGPIILHGKELLYSIIHDITERKRAVAELRKAHDGLEQRTAELEKLNEKLRKREAELEIQTSELEEVNTALRVLLKRRNEDKIELEEKTLSNVKQLVLPYVARLKSSGLDANQVTYVNILESNLKDIVSPFSRRLSSTYLGLTPTEIQIANLVKEGKTTKEIAEALHSSPRTVEFHRNKIREKIGIKNSKANLRSYLLSM